MKKFIEIVKLHSLENKDLFFSINALVGELGELANVLKKEVFYNEWPEYKNGVDKDILEGKRKSFKEQKIDESGDVLFYYIQLLNKFNITVDEVIEYQINKLKEQSKEYNRKFLK